MADPFTGLRFRMTVAVRHMGPDQFQLLEDVGASWDGGALRVPAGYVTDGYSVPRVFRRIMSRTGRSMVPAILHDALYTDDAEGGAHFTQSDADRLLLVAMRVAGYAWPIRNGAWLATRIGGRFMWRDGRGGAR